MKKIFKYVPLIACAFILSGCGNSNTSSAFAKMKLFYSYEASELNCPVKSIDTRTYEATSKFGEAVKGKLLGGYYQVEEFNNLGRLEKITYYDNNVNILQLLKYTYDPKGNISELAKYSADGELETLTKYVCREDGLDLERDRYDNKGELIFSSRCTYEGDELISDIKVTYNGADTLVNEMASIYNGDMLEECKYITDGKLCYTWKYSKFEKYGSREYEMYDDLGELVIKGEEKFDKNGELVYFYYVNRANVVNEQEIKRNEKNLVTYERTVEDGEETITEYEYEYDQKGNWIKKIEFEGTLRKPVKITEREIVY